MQTDACMVKQYFTHLKCSYFMGKEVFNDKV